MFGIDDIINAIGGANAAADQQRNINDAMTLQRHVYQGDEANFAPYQNAGLTSLAAMQRMTKPGYDMSQLENDPGFQFRMQEGQKALERSAAARGGLASGGFMKGLDRYSQGVASDEFGNRFNRLGTLAGMGMNADQIMSNRGMGYANSMSSLYGANANAQAAGDMAITNGISGTIKSAGNLGMMYATGGMSAPMSMGGGGAGYSGNGTFGAGINPSNYSIGYGGGYGMSPQSGGGYGGNYSLGNYNLIPPQMGGGY